MNILVVAAHPDDEILGCGGTVARHTARGDRVDILILAEGITSRDATRNRARRQPEIEDLGKAARQAARLLGVRQVELHHFPDNRMDQVPMLEVTKVVEAGIARFRPEIVYTHHAGDVNVDHQRTHDAVMTAIRPQPGNPVRTILCFETASSTEWQVSRSRAFTPDWFVDISATLSRKMRALEAYRSEMRSWPHARSVTALQHLARWRGASVGVEAAEAFMLARNIVR